MPDSEETPTPARQGGVDWEAIEPHWRAGIVSMRQLVREFGVSRPAMVKHFRKLGIERALTAQIQGEATTLVQRAEAAGARSVAVPEPPADGRQTDRDTVGINARIQANVILTERATIRRAQTLALQLLTELESQTFDATMYERLDKLMRQAGASGKLAKDSIAQLSALYARTTTTTQRTENMRKLSDILKTLTELERKVHGIAEDTPVDPQERVREAVESGLEELKARFRRHLSLVPQAKAA